MKYMMTERISKILHNQKIDDYQTETNEEKIHENVQYIM
jgi:hypothetical protein